MPFRKPDRSVMDEQPTGAPVGDDRSAPDLHGLDHADPAIRKAAILALEGEPGALQALVARLALEKDEPTREALALVLSRTADAHVADGLLPLLRSRDAELRSLAAEILTEHETAVAPRLPMLLGDDDPRFRIHLLTILKSLKIDTLSQIVVDVLRLDPDVNVVAAALDLAHSRQADMDFDALNALGPALIARFPDQAFIAFAYSRTLDALKSTRR